MPAQYEAIKRSFRKSHPKMPLKAVKRHAAMIAIAAAKKAGKPMPKFHRKKKHGGKPTMMGR